MYYLYSSAKCPIIFIVYIVQSANSCVNENAYEHLIQLSYMEKDSINTEYCQLCISTAYPLTNIKSKYRIVKILDLELNYDHPLPNCGGKTLK